MRSAARVSAVSPDWEMVTNRGVRADGDAAIAEFAGHLHLAGDADVFLDPVARHRTGMEAGAAGDDLDLGGPWRTTRTPPDRSLGQDLTVTQAAFQGALDHTGLLVDLLEHEVAIGALVGGLAAFVVLHRLALGPARRSFPERDLIQADLGHVTLFQVDEAIGHLTQRQLVRGSQVVLAQTQAR